jgi:hypothetical protein
MGWQAEVFARLRDRQWHKIGDLFEAVEQEIPLHYAMRHTMQPGRRQRAEMPVNSVARWDYFLSVLSSIGIEGDGDPHKRKWSDHARLRYVADRVCEACGGPVIRATWTGKQIACLACEAAAAVPREFAPAKEVQIVVVDDPVRPISEKVQVPAIAMQAPMPAPGKPSLAWVYRLRKAFAVYLKFKRLPFLSPTKIQRELDRYHDSVEQVCSRYGRPPLTQPEFNGWLQHYVQTHPP